MTAPRAFTNAVFDAIRASFPAPRVEARVSAPLMSIRHMLAGTKPVQSVAIVPEMRALQRDFGDNILMLKPREWADPEAGANVYAGDAWTPTSNNPMAERYAEPRGVEAHDPLKKLSLRSMRRFDNLDQVKSFVGDIESTPLDERRQYQKETQSQFSALSREILAAMRLRPRPDDVRQFTSAVGEVMDATPVGSIPHRRALENSYMKYWEPFDTPEGLDRFLAAIKRAQEPQNHDFAESWRPTRGRPHDIIGAVFEDVDPRHEYAKDLREVRNTLDKQRIPYEVVSRPAETHSVEEMEIDFRNRYAEREDAANVIRARNFAKGIPTALGAAIMAGAGVAALPSGAEAQETPQDPPLGSDPATDSLIAAIRRGAGMTETAPEGEDEGGMNWGLLAGTTAAIAAAALGGSALTRALTRSGPSAPPIPSRGLVRQLTTHAPITHPTTPAQAQAIAAAQAERQVAVARLRSLVDPIDPNDEHITRTVDQALATGPSYARQMRPVDAQIADIQESLVRHGLVKTSGTVHDVDLVRTAKELVARAGNEEFWLKDPERVLSSPEQLAAAIAAQDNGAAMAAAINRSLDPTLTFEEQQFASRVAGEFMQRMIGAQQRVTRDISETGRTLRATQLLGDIFAKNGNNGQAWLAAAVRIAGTDLQAADASAIVRLAVSGQYSAAAKKLNMLRTAHPLDKLDEGLRSAMQLTFFRPFRDMLGNLTNVADFATAGRIASIADIGLSVFSGQREVMPPGLGTQLKVLGQGFKTGGTDALRLLMRQNVDGDMEFMRRVAERMDFTNETTFTHPVTNFLATQARRWFTAADYPAYRMAFNDALADMSMVAAYKAGHRGTALGQAAMDLFEAPGPALTIKAQAEAIERVWQNRNFVSTATNSFMANASPTTRFMARRVMPFVHTASTQIGQALNQSPVGYFKTAADLGKFVWSSIKKDAQGDAQRQLARRLGLHATGLGWLSLGYYLADNGRIQGTFESDPRARDAQEEQNQRPMTIEVNGKWYAASILLGPQAMLMAMGAGLHQGLKNMAEQEAADPEMEQRWSQSLWAAAKPVGDETIGALSDLPLADGVKNIGAFAKDWRTGTGGQAMGGLAGRIAAQPIPAFVQQYAETQDLDAEGDVVRRDTRGSTFSEAFMNTVREATPGQRTKVPVRATPLGKDGKGISVGDSPLTSLVNPLRNQYDEQEDWVVQALIDHDAFPAHQGRHEGETQAAYNARRMAEGDEEYEALANAMDGQVEFGLEFADQKLLQKWYSEGAPIPSADYTALLRSVSSGLRRARTAERNKRAQASRP